MKIINKIFDGEIHGYSVIVEDLSLFDHAQFGSGSVSRSRPEQHQFKRKRQPRNKKRKRRKVEDDDEEEEPNQLNISFHKCLRPLIQKMNRIFSKFLTASYAGYARMLKHKEVLVLSPYEYCFLSCILGCLRLKLNDKVLTTKEVWQYCINMCGEDAFIRGFVAYHHFRSKGWIVRSGVKYGCDFTLYKDAPDRVHADFSVLVLDAQDPQLKTWRDFQHTARLTGTVAKSLIFCYVQIPKIDFKNSSPAKVLEECRIRIVKAQRVVLTKFLKDVSQK